VSGSFTKMDRAAGLGNVPAKNTLGSPWYIQADQLMLTNGPPCECEVNPLE